MKLFSFGLGIIFLAVAVFCAAFVPAAWYSQPSVSAPTVTLVVSANDGASAVAAKLVDGGALVTSYGYRIYALIDPAARHPRLGTYAVKPGMSYRTIARMLAAGPEREETQLQVIEGWDLKDIAGMLTRNGVTSTADFFASTGNLTSNTPFDPTWRTEFPFLSSLPKNATLEGYLFPDTYRVWKDQLPESLIRKQLEAFASHTMDFAAQAKAQGRSLQDVVTLASIVEKEVQTPADRRIVAGIFLNRLDVGIALQSDATINYVTGSGRTRSNAEDLAVDSPYNTYKYRGLPPGPISNPGADALEAALHPTPNDYLYFLTGKDGKVYYAKTLEEHNQNKVKAFGG